MNRSFSSNTARITTKKTAQLKLALRFLCAAVVFNSHVVNANSKLTNALLQTEPDRIVVAAPLAEDRVTHEYNIAVLRLALEHSEDKYEKFDIHISDKIYSNARALVALNKENSDVDVHASITSEESEAQTIPIRIPIRFGIFGYRLLIIHKDEEKEFSEIKNIASLARKKPGFVDHWVINKAYRMNNLNTELVHNIESIFKMVNVKRIDYSSRGVNEVYSDMEKYASGLDNIIIEPTLCIYTPLPYYIFVRKSRPELAERIQYGLQQALQNGSLRKLFNRYHQEAILRANLDQRRTLYLSNPSLPSKTPIDSKALWFFHDDKVHNNMLNIN